MFWNMSIHLGNNKLCPIWSLLIQVKCRRRLLLKIKKRSWQERQREKEQGLCKEEESVR